MSIIKLNKALRHINNKKINLRKICTEATVNISEEILQLKTNGVPSIISISYKGELQIKSLMPIYIKVLHSKQKIIINNIFKKSIPEDLFLHNGNFSIVNVVIISQDGSKISSTINNNQNLNLINKSDTNLEDDTLIFFEEPAKKRKTLFNSGIIKNKIPNYSFNSQGKVQKAGKKEIEEISSIITEIRPSITSISKAEIAKPKRTLSLKKEKSIIDDKVRYGDVQGNFKKYRK